jgi:hypothetical protein
LFPGLFDAILIVDILRRASALGDKVCSGNILPRGGLFFGID